MHVLDRQSRFAAAFGTPRTSPDTGWYCRPLVTFGALPSQLRLVVYICVRETLSAAALGELLHCLNRQFGTPAALTAPCPLLDIMRCSHPLVTFGTLPGQL